MNNGKKDTVAVDADEASGLAENGKSLNVSCIVMSETGRNEKAHPKHLQP